MKTTKFIFTLCLVGCTLISCNPYQEEGRKELKQQADNLASFLTDNYSVGDSVFFQTPDGETEGFVVRENGMDEINEVTLIEDEEPEYFLLGYVLCTELKSEKNSIKVIIHIMRDYKSNIETTAAINLIGLNYVSLPNTAILYDDVTIACEWQNSSCILQRNVGLTKIKGENYSWELVK